MKKTKVTEIVHKPLADQVIKLMQGQVNKLESITASYITYNKDDKKFNKWLEKKLKEVKQNDNKSEDPGKSKDGDKKSKRKAG